jgi:hypothetical protein
MTRAMNARKAPVTVLLPSERIVRRINYRLRPRGLKLLKSRTPEQREAIGLWFIVDTKHNVSEHHVELPQLAKQLGCVRAWEELTC